MALPAVKTLHECLSFDDTVLRYLPQLYDLPQQIIKSWNNSAELQDLYLSTNPLITAFAFSLFLAPLFLLISEINKNYSQVDRMWSILPTLYIAHYTLYAHMSGLPTERLDHLVAVSTVWSVRLTFNYWRKGGYKIGGEDYRWAILRERINPAVFFIFNVLFISLGQSILLFLITTPPYVMLLAARLRPEMSMVDIIFPRALMLLILLEFTADQQQWNFQTAKKLYQKTAKLPPKFEQEDLDRGFVVTGLWSWSRHPNFAAEQAIWVVVYQWGCYITDTLYNWTLVGAISYLALFQASAWFSESISAGKYPEYKEYQRRVGKFIPRLSSDLPGDFSDEKVTPAVEEKKKKGAVAAKK
ncbi:Uncharacterized protein BP5553_00706 [Venustampulla echinocandica]|uniref:DUF1295-domain-containing protein n=1 Tax=Venustampulla echinocandica TaxID=2656787 RepID=A0A370TYX3_9HELO|nr:Uncharacterized protein BP5553_00706 [Venustampulla echinocandica]RDL40727.1 Uncharacterized protein BP5553_00706 [Venustampulla echinocandica]